MRFRLGAPFAEYPRTGKRHVRRLSSFSRDVFAWVSEHPVRFRILCVWNTLATNPLFIAHVRPGRENLQTHSISLADGKYNANSCPALLIILPFQGREWPGSQKLSRLESWEPILPCSPANSSFTWVTRVSLAAFLRLLG